MSLVENYAYPNFVGDVVPHQLFNGIIENIDGGKMYVADFITIDLEGEEMSKKTYLQELTHSFKMTWPFLTLVIGSSYGFFYFTQGRIDTQMAEVRAQIASDRKDASADNAALRNDVNSGFNRVADKLEDINKTLSNVQIEQAVQKSKNQQP